MLSTKASDAGQISIWQELQVPDMCDQFLFCAGGTRTCIHTPGAALRPDDMTPEFCESVLRDAKLVYFDGRLTEAALVVAHAAKQASIPILVEAERLRPDLDMLMAPADYLVTSRNFPEDWTGEENIGDAMLATMLRLPGIKWMVRFLSPRSVHVPFALRQSKYAAASRKYYLSMACSLHSFVPSRMLLQYAITPRRGQYRSSYT